MAQTSEAIHGNGLILVCLVLLLVVLCCVLLQAASLRLLLTHRDLVKRLLHPSHFPKGSVWQQVADTLRAWLDRTAPAAVEDTSPTAPPLLTSPARTYEFQNAVAAGDLCDVYAAVSAGMPYILKSPRVRGCDVLLRNEQAILRELHQRSAGDSYERYLPLPVEAFRWQHRSYFAFGRQEGLVPAAEIRRQYPAGLSGRHIAWMLNRTLEILGFVHRQGFIHGAVLPPHLLFEPEAHGMQLIGWTHAVPCGQPLEFAPRDYKAWYPPECLRRQATTPATDIYLAARSMIWLAGGDPLTAVMPDGFPPEILHCLTQCLSDDPADRPQDAWQLHEELHEVLEAVYGPAQFCPLTIT